MRTLLLLILVVILTISGCQTMEVGTKKIVVECKMVGMESKCINTK